MSIVITHLENKKIPVYFNENIQEFFYAYSKVFILMDENTKQHCYPIFISKNPTLKNAICISLPAGENQKNLENLSIIWKKLTQYQADRKSLLVNLGGGMIGDLGGFAAACYKRGIDFIQIPTTLLAQVDAAIGGKTGINFLDYKNQIGLFAAPRCIVIHTKFLNTLAQREYFSGYMEIFKYTLISPKIDFSWKNFSIEFENKDELQNKIRHCIQIKDALVQKDPLDLKERKLLNFGHTIGHALESYFLKTNTPLLHGEAVGWGMLIELRLSVEMGFSAEHLEIITALKKILHQHMPFGTLPKLEEIIPYLYQDKKNEDQEIQFVTFKKVGDLSILPLKIELLKKVWVSNFAI
jgi:3-dehydroquinate synthase